jgi:hypothetical protein
MFFIDLSKDIVTHLLSFVSSDDIIALLAVYPDISKLINWNMLYYNKNTPLHHKLESIYNKHFPISKEDRIIKMYEYYYKYKYDKLIPDDGDTWLDEDIPILDYDQYYKLQDYIYSISDYIYNDIRSISKNI